MDKSTNSPLKENNKQRKANSIRMKKIFQE